MDINFILSILLPLGLAIVLGGLLGIERTLAGKVAGMRTYALVALGSASFVLISELAGGVMGDTAIDYFKLIPQILVGVGFIGAGLVILKNDKVTGLTSAAGLWVSAAIGIACALGISSNIFYVLAITITILTLCIFTILWFIEKMFKKFNYSNLENHNGKHEDEEM